MSWHNAPLLNKLTAAPLGGEFGAQIWGVDFKGTLYSTYQLTRGGGWDEWRGPGWNQNKLPDQVYELASAQLTDGRTQLWVLDMKRQLWSIAEDKTGGDWGDWQGPNWHQPPGKEGLKKITAARVKNKTQLWGILDSGMLISCNMLLPSGVSPWQDFPKTKEGLPWIEVTACTQGTSGQGALWGIDNKLQLWGTGQDGNGNWGGWTGPNWLRAPKVRNIAAVDMSGNKGATIFAITEDYKVIFNWQTAGGLDSWFGWQPADANDALRAYEITAAQQNDGLSRVWVVNMAQLLTSMAMDRQAHNWSRHWEPPV